jgi:hypothetical protein
MMNERIRELAEQARQYAIETIKNSQDPTEWSTAVFEQKFAQLSGQECLALADSIRDECDKDGENQQALGAAWVGIAIARHFGVKE